MLFAGVLFLYSTSRFYEAGVLAFLLKEYFEGNQFSLRVDYDSVFIASGRRVHSNL